MNEEKEITPTGDGLPEGFDADLLSQLTPEERAALEEMSLTLHADPDAPVDMEAGADGEDDADAGIVLQEAAAAPVMYAAPRASAPVDVNSLIDALRNETREGSITPERLAEIFEAVKNAGAGLTPADKQAIETAQSTADSALLKATEAVTSAGSAQTSAQKAADNASKAQIAADNSATLASEAATTADSAAKTALTAKSTAEDALKKAEQALESGGTGGSGGTIDPDELKKINDSIATAKSTANNAQSTANNASSSAATANNLASSAKTTADSAKTTAETAKSTADSALKKATANEEAIKGMQGQKFWKGTLTEYEALTSYDDDTIYYIIPDS